MSNIVYIAKSLDGFIARKNGECDWLERVPNPENSDFGFADFMERTDAVLMGRNTFETVVSFGHWPYQKPVFVLSDKLKKIPENLHGKAEIIRGDLKKILHSFHEKGFRHIYIDGGKTIQSFLALNLIDELIITTVPVLLGSGIPLFAELDFEISFRHVKTEVLNNFLVKSHYRKAD